MFVKKICILSLLACVPAVFFSQTASSSTAAPSASSSASPVIIYNDDFAKGEELFTLNKPEDAIPFLENAVTADGVDPAVYVYLGVAYYQIKEYQKSLDICVTGLAKPGSDKTVLSFNAGNSAYAMGNYARAEACYTIALKNDENYVSAYLNKANAQLKQDHLEDARQNYETFLDKAPNDPQAPQIQQLLELLDEEIARRAREKPELILPEDLNIENSGMDMPEPEYVEDSVAPEVPPEPGKDIGDQFADDKPGMFVEPKNAPYGEERLSAEEAQASEIPADQLTHRSEAPQTGAGEVVPSEDAASPAMPEEPSRVTDSETGEVVELSPLPEIKADEEKAAAPTEPVTLPVLPAPQLKPDAKPMEAVESDDDELMPADYWESEY